MNAPLKLAVKTEEFLLTHSLNESLQALSCFHSTRKVKRSLVYRAARSQIEPLLSGIEYGLYAGEMSYEKKPFYRAAAWNVERGLHFEGLLETLTCHPDLSKADLLFLPETDIGMARSQNRNVARELAKALGMNYFFAPSYLNLCKGNSVEGHFEGENELGLHGNAFLSRYPIENLRAIPLKNCKDKMKGREKRLGQQKALVADVQFPFQTITAVTVHLDAHSSQRQRAAQIRTILEALTPNPYPVLLGGDLNTSTYNARHALFAFFGFWNKVFRGVDRIIDEHYPYPDRFFDRRIFDRLRASGFDYLSWNELGVGTLHYHVEDVRSNHMVREVVPEWCRKIMEETLKRHGGRVSLKLDWFAGRGITAADPEQTGASPPKVIPALRHQGRMISDHDPILVDVDIYNSA